ncbi:MAG TPA: hypothetical protein VL359_04635, partial [bacterium]|nr:hypothetical protein [bacterium]
MKWRTLIVAIAAAAVVLGVLAFANHRAVAQRYGGYGPGWGRGPGMMWDGDYDGWGGGPGFMWGGGPGFMWGGPGRWGDWDDLGAYSQVPQDKRAQLRDLAVDIQRKMVSLTAPMQELMLAYSSAVQKFPVDRDAAS